MKYKYCGHIVDVSLQGADWPKESDNVVCGHSVHKLSLAIIL